MRLFLFFFFLGGGCLLCGLCLSLHVFSSWLLLTNTLEAKFADCKYAVCGSAQNEYFLDILFPCVLFWCCCCWYACVCVCVRGTVDSSPVKLLIFDNNNGSSLQNQFCDCFTQTLFVLIPFDH